MLTDPHQITRGQRRRDLGQRLIRLLDVVARETIPGVQAAFFGVRGGVDFRRGDEIRDGFEVLQERQMLVFGQTVGVVRGEMISDHVHDVFGIQHDFTPGFTWGARAIRSSARAGS
ncbi:hypothetical protein [Allokutzneria albata]|uniref:hypothetical protein n=1 Tax=Allokutzneria albata TaxID=211114 RepID=UPI00200C6BAA|nr:hypothetical protein [Allokutzneria albata]